MSHFGSYEEIYPKFNWQMAETELGYKDGELLNIGYMCSDRICKMGLADKIALIWEDYQGESKRFTYNDIRVYSNTFADFLRGLGVKPGERVCIFMDKIPELYISFLGILKLGAVAQPLFSAFGEDSLLTRLENAETAVVLTTKKHFRKVRRLKDKLPALRHLVIVDDKTMKVEDRETLFSMYDAPYQGEFPAFPAARDTLSVLHYTSGTTGQPKGAMHVHSSIFSQYLTAKWVMDFRPDDIYWCTADPGWVTGTSYGIIGPWSNGMTQVVLDAGFSSEKWYQFIQKHKVTVWYSAPTAIRSLMRDGEEVIKKYDLSSLRHLTSVGEPLNPEAVIWSERVFGLPFHDTFWQTETGCIVITNLPGMKIKPGSMGKPFPGMKATIIHPEQFTEVAEGQVGLIGLQPGWPSLMRGYWRNEATYKSKFKNGWYITGDRGYRDKDGYFWFVGRVDDVINTGGHLVGPFEIESALIEHEAVAEAAAVSKPDPLNMEVVKAFVALKVGYEASDDLELSIMNFIRKRLSPLAMPQEIEFVKSLPKTRSGKIIRRMLRAKEWGEPIGDISTLEED